METLYTDRLILREWQESDSKDLFEYAQSELVGPNAGWRAHKDEEESKEIIRQFIEDEEGYAIVLKSENKVIGGIGLYEKRPDDSLFHLKQKELGYVLNPKYWGRGIVPEAAKSLIEYGFNKMDLDLIWCGYFDYNNNSKRVAEKCGFKYRLHKKENLVLLDDKEVIIIYNTIFKTDYENGILSNR